MAFSAAEVEYDVLCKIILVGDSGSGKSALMRRVADNEFEAGHICTIGVDLAIRNLRMKDGKIAKAQIWDTAGQDRFRAIIAAYYRGAHAVAFVFDVTDRQSFASIRYWMKEVSTYGDEGVNLMLIANKADLERDRVVSNEEIADFAKEMGMSFIETSAKTGTNVESAFMQIAETHCNSPSVKLLKRTGGPRRKVKLASSPLDGAKRTLGCCTIL